MFNSNPLWYNKKNNKRKGYINLWIILALSIQNISYCNLLQYVKEHGYQLDNIGEMFLVISIVTFIIFLILLLKNLLVKN